MAISGGFKVPGVQELVARAKKIMQWKIKPTRNCPFEQLEWSLFFSKNSFVP